MEIWQWEKILRFKQWKQMVLDGRCKQIWAGCQPNEADLFILFIYYSVVHTVQHKVKHKIKHKKKREQIYTRKTGGISAICSARPTIYLYGQLTAA